MLIYIYIFLYLCIFLCILFILYSLEIIDKIVAMKDSNSKAEARVQELTTYIADIDAGRIEFTSERVDLEKELEELNSDLEASSELRAKEKQDLLSAR